MKIGFDIQSTLGKKTGIPRYALNLMDALRGLPDAPEIIPFQNGLRRDFKTYVRLWYEASVLPSKIQKSSTRPDLVHVPGFGIRKPARTKVVLTAHDLIGYLFPENLSPTARLYWSHWLPNCYKQADYLIADSEHTKNDLMVHLGIPEKKISVIYLAPDPSCIPVSKSGAAQAVRDALGISEPYFLFVGTIEPRKNLVRTLKAYALALAEKKDIPKLVVVGAKEWGRSVFGFPRTIQPQAGWKDPEEARVAVAREGRPQNAFCGRGPIPA